MNLKDFVSLVAIAVRPRLVATALVYGLSLTVHFTSAAGEKPQAPAPITMTSNAGAQAFHEESRPNSAPQMIFHRDWPTGAAGCHAASESPGDAELLIASIDAPTTSFHVSARQSHGACHTSSGGDERTSEKV